MTQQALVVSNKDVILERLAKGDLVRDIAADLGVHRVVISQTLAADPAYKAAQLESIEARLEQAETDLREANDGLSLGRSRELLSHARWRAQVTAPHIYARPNTAVQVNSDGPTQVKIISWNDAT